MKKLSLFILFSFLIVANYAQKKEPFKKPKLVVGIVIDQMRYDYLMRFADKYSSGGFNRLLKDGFSMEDAHYNYVPTYTAVGHTSIYTGTTPATHGIISNNWYDKYLKKSVYCVDDTTYTTVGSTTSTGKKSPKKLLTTTITDQLHLAQNMRGKTIGIALKDRSAILPAGHTANAAYWFDGGNEGKWITSTYYMKTLPTWVQNFNKNGKATKYVNTPWNTLYNINTYTESIADNNKFEGRFRGEKAPVFPHNIPALKAKNGNYSIIKAIPAGNTFTTDFAKAAILGEHLGKSKYTDFLALSYSSTDYVGHKYGVAAKETEDTYLRLDKTLADLFSFLDTNIGKGNYTLFLTADHAATQVPAYLQTLKIPANYFNNKKYKEFINGIATKYFKATDLIENISNFQIFLNKDAIEKHHLNANTVAQKLADESINFDGIYKAVTARTLQTRTFTSGLLHKLQMGYNQKMSGDVLLVLAPETISYSRTGTTHGSGYNYDTHIPMIFYGAGIKSGRSKKAHTITDIAPTISNLLSIEFPNGTTGKIIEEVFK